MSSRSVLPAQKFWPDTQDAEPKVHFALTIAQTAIQQHEEALISLKSQVDAVVATQTAASGGSTTPVTPPATTTPVLGQVNNQTDVTYTVQNSDYGGLITFNNAAPVAVTLNPAVQQFWFASVENLGAGLVTFTPGTGTVNGFASIQITTGMGGQIFYDGTNWWAFTVPTQPLTFAAVAHEFLTSYSSVTGLFTAVQPAAADISGLGTAATRNTTGAGAAVTTGPGISNIGDIVTFASATGQIGDSSVMLANIPKLNSANIFTAKNTFIAPTRIVMTLLNGYANLGGVLSTAQYWLDPATQLVHIAGVLTVGTSAIIAQLPTGFRPTATQSLTVNGANGTADIMGQLQVDTSGNLSLTFFANFSAFISLDGVSFPAF